MTAPLLPNRLHYDHADTMVGLPIGDVHSIRPNSFGLLDIRFMYGTRLEVTPEALRRICRDGVTALAGLPLATDQIHDACEVPDAS